MSKPMNGSTRGLTTKAATAVFAAIILVGGTGADDANPHAASTATAADVVDAMAEINPFRQIESRETRGHGRHLDVRGGWCFKTNSSANAANFRRGCPRPGKIEKICFYILLIHKRSAEK